MLQARHRAARCSVRALDVHPIAMTHLVKPGEDTGSAAAHVPEMMAGSSPGSGRRQPSGGEGPRRCSSVPSRLESQVQGLRVNSDGRDQTRVGTDLVVGVTRGAAATGAKPRLCSTPGGFGVTVTGTGVARAARDGDSSHRPGVLSRRRRKRATPRPPGGQTRTSHNRNLCGESGGWLSGSVVTPAATTYGHQRQATESDGHQTSRATVACVLRPMTSASITPVSTPPSGVLEIWFAASQSPLPPLPSPPPPPPVRSGRRLSVSLGCHTASSVSPVGVVGTSGAVVPGVTPVVHCTAGRGDHVGVQVHRSDPGERPDPAGWRRCSS